MRNKKFNKNVKLKRMSGNSKIFVRQNDDGTFSSVNSKMENYDIEESGLKVFFAVIIGLLIAIGIYLTFHHKSTNIDIYVDIFGKYKCKYVGQNQNNMDIESVFTTNNYSCDDKHTNPIEILETMHKSVEHIHTNNHKYSFDCMAKGISIEYKNKKFIIIYKQNKKNSRINILTVLVKSKIFGLNILNEYSFV